jgi:Fic family protein
MSSRYLAIDDLRDDLRDLLDSRPDAAALFQRAYEMSWFYHENALEGVVLTEEEILLSLEYHVVPDATLLQLVTLVRNHRDALSLVKAEANRRGGALEVSLLTTLFQTLARGLDGKPDALWRREMPLHRAYYHDIVQPAKIAPELEKLCAFTGTAEFREFHPLKQAAHVHWGLMHVYPFVEHNGRIARLAQAVYLLRAGYPPAIIHAIDRQRYYDVLRVPSSSLRALLNEAMQNSLENAKKYFRARREAARRAASG